MTASNVIFTDEGVPPADAVGVLEWVTVPSRAVKPLAAGGGRTSYFVIDEGGGDEAEGTSGGEIAACLGYFIVSHSKGRSGL